MPSSTVNTECNIHRVLYHPKIDCLLHPATLSSHISQWTLLYPILCILAITSYPMNKVSNPIPPPSWSNSARSTASKYSSNLDWSWPPCATPNLLDYGLQVYLQTWSIMASKHISELIWPWPPSDSPNWLTYSLQYRMSMASRFARLWHWCAFLNTLDLGLQIHL